jgi:hypothetical protein
MLISVRFRTRNFLICNRMAFSDTILTAGLKLTNTRLRLRSLHTRRRKV